VVALLVLVTPAGGRVSSGSIGMGASRVPSAASPEAFRAVVVVSFFVVAMPRPERRVGRFDFGFLGVLYTIYQLIFQSIKETHLSLRSATSPLDT
jgi:hypothetical protein